MTFGILHTRMIRNLGHINVFSFFRASGSIVNVKCQHFVIIHHSFMSLFITSGNAEYDK